MMDTQDAGLQEPQSPAYSASIVANSVSEQDSLATASPFQLKLKNLPVYRSRSFHSESFGSPEIPVIGKLLWQSNKEQEKQRNTKEFAEETENDDDSQWDERSEILLPISSLFSEPSNHIVMVKNINPSTMATVTSPTQGSLATEISSTQATMETKASPAHVTIETETQGSLATEVTSSPAALETEASPTHITMETVISAKHVTMATVSTSAQVAMDSQGSTIFKTPPLPSVMKFTPKQSSRLATVVLNLKKAAKNTNKDSNPVILQKVQTELPKKSSDSNRKTSQKNRKMFGSSIENKNNDSHDKSEEDLKAMVPEVDSQEESTRKNGHDIAFTGSIELKRFEAINGGDKPYLPSPSVFESSVSKSQDRDRNETVSQMSEADNISQDKENSKKGNQLKLKESKTCLENAAPLQENLMVTAVSDKDGFQKCLPFPERLPTLRKSPRLSMDVKATQQLSSSDSKSSTGHRSGHTGTSSSSDEKPPKTNKISMEERLKRKHEYEIGALNKIEKQQHKLQTDLHSDHHKHINIGKTEVSLKDVGSLLSTLNQTHDKEKTLIHSRLKSGNLGKAEHGSLRLQARLLMEKKKRMLNLVQQHKYLSSQLTELKYQNLSGCIPVMDTKKSTVAIGNTKTVSNLNTKSKSITKPKSKDITSKRHWSNGDTIQGSAQVNKKSKTMTSDTTHVISAYDFGDSQETTMSLSELNTLPLLSKKMKMVGTKLQYTQCREGEQNGQDSSTGPFKRKNSCNIDEISHIKAKVDNALTDTCRNPDLKSLEHDNLTGKDCNMMGVERSYASTSNGIHLEDMLEIPDGHTMSLAPVAEESDMGAELTSLMGLEMSQLSSCLDLSQLDKYIGDEIQDPDLKCENVDANQCKNTNPNNSGCKGTIIMVNKQAGICEENSASPKHTAHLSSGGHSKSINANTCEFTTLCGSHMSQNAQPCVEMISAPSRLLQTSAASDNMLPDAKIPAEKSTKTTVPNPDHSQIQKYDHSTVLISPPPTITPTSSQAFHGEKVPMMSAPPSVMSTNPHNVHGGTVSVMSPPPPVLSRHQEGQRSLILPVSSYNPRIALGGPSSILSSPIGSITDTSCHKLQGPADISYIMRTGKNPPVLATVKDTVVTDRDDIAKKTSAVIQWPSLKELLQATVIKPGHKVFSITTKERLLHGSLTERGQIRCEASGQLYNTPVAWCNGLGVLDPEMANLVRGFTVHRRDAYHKVHYKGVPLAKCKLPDGFVTKNGPPVLSKTKIATPAVILKGNCGYQKSSNKATAVQSFSNKLKPGGLFLEDSNVQVSAILHQPVTNTRISNIQTADGISVLLQNGTSVEQATNTFLKDFFRNCNVRLISDSEIVMSSSDLPKDFWKNNDFQNIKLPKNFMEGIDRW